MHNDLRVIEKNLNKNENVAGKFNAYTKSALFYDNVEINTSLLRKTYDLEVLQKLPLS